MTNIVSLNQNKNKITSVLTETFNIVNFDSKFGIDFMIDSLIVDLREHINKTNDTKNTVLILHSAYVLKKIIGNVIIPLGAHSCIDFIKINPGNKQAAKLLLLRPSEEEPDTLTPMVDINISYPDANSEPIAPNLLDLKTVFVDKSKLYKLNLSVIYGILSNLNGICAVNGGHISVTATKNEDYCLVKCILPYNGNFNLSIQVYIENMSIRSEED